MVTMERIELALEVGPIPAATDARLNDAGYEVYQGRQTWRVIAETEADGGREQLLDRAMMLANDILIDFRLDPLHRPPTVTLRYPNAAIDLAVGSLVLEDARRASDPDPLAVHDRSWWHKARDPLLRDTQDG